MSGTGIISSNGGGGIAGNLSGGNVTAGAITGVSARNLIGVVTPPVVAAGNWSSANIPISTEADSSNNSANCRALCIAPANADITDISVCFTGVGYVNGTPIENIPNAYTINTLAIEYPLGTTPTQIYFSGAASATIQPGTASIRSDPYPLFIPRGAQFAVKCYVAWTGTFWFGINLGSVVTSGEWAARGTSVTDHTLDNTVLTNTTSTWGFRPIIYATLNSRQPCIGAIGDSIMVGNQDQTDPVSHSTSWMRGLVNQVPMLNMAIGGCTAVTFLSRPEIHAALMRGNITHFITDVPGINDINGVSGTPTLAGMQANLEALINPWLARGVLCSAMTITPNTSSTDNFITTANQTIVAGNETIRLQYNAWLLSNQANLGLQNVFDAAGAVDPNNIGKWAADPGTLTLYTTGAGQGAGYATLTGGVVSSVAYGGGFQYGGTAGSGYADNVTGTWFATTYPGQTGHGAYGTVTSNGSGQLTTWTVTSGGSGYNVPPMIDVMTTYTNGGLHPSVRGYDRMIAMTGFGPAAFTF